MTRRRPFVPLALALAVFAPTAPAEDSSNEATAVAASNGVVIHGVDTKLLAARLRDADRKALAGDARGAGEDLAALLTSEVPALIEDGDNAYLSASEAALQRVAALPPEGLARYRELADPLARALLALGTARADPAVLAPAALRLGLTTDGPRLLVTLADLRAARGDASGAARALFDLLRLWPEGSAFADMPGVERAAVVERFAALTAALGDAETVDWLRRTSSAALLAAASPVTRGASLADDLARLATVARRGRADVPAVPFRLAAQFTFSAERGGSDGLRWRDVDERPVAVGTDERPVLVTREPMRLRNDSAVVALGTSESLPGALVRLWQWPSKQEANARLRRGGRGRFQPARCGDVVVFTWPRAPEERVERGREFAQSLDERNSLIALSVSADGRLVDERGADEEGRDDADPELETMSFAGAPLVSGNSVYATLVRRSPNGGATELHLARFDLVADGATQRLVRRWRTHVLDGNAMPRVLYNADQALDYDEALAVPAPPAERWGRIYLSSNTGAVACVDGASGRTLWAHAYPRFGPPLRAAVSSTEQVTWGEVPVRADGPIVYAAPRDAEALLQFRAMPRLARTTLLSSFRFHGGGGTSAVAGQLLPSLHPFEVVGIADGVAWLAGSVEGVRVGALVPAGSPLAGIRLREPAPGDPRRGSQYAQIPEPTASGSACIAAGALLFPTAKGIYRVALDAFESAPTVLWQPPAARRGAPQIETVGTLVADGRRVWSVTRSSVVLLTPAE